MKRPLTDVDKKKLHRILRAMHDGECPRCMTIGPSDRLQDSNGYSCPDCGFEISRQQADAILEMFKPQMRDSLKAFQSWLGV